MNKTEFLQQLRAIDDKSTLKLSMYLPTHRTQPDNKQDPILFKNLKNEAYDKLREQANLFEPQLEAIQNDLKLFNSTLDSLAIFMTPTQHIIVKLAIQVKPQVIVGENFHIVPLLNYFNEKNIIYGLDIRKDSFDLFEITRYGREKIENHEIITNFAELYDDFDANSNLNFSSQGSFHGHRSSGEEVDNDRLKYFRYLAREFSDKYSDKLDTFVVFGNTENISAFKDHFSQELLSVQKPLRDMDQKQVIIEMRDVLAPQEQEQRNNLESRYAIALDRKLLNNDPQSIKKDIEFGRVDMLMIKDSISEDYDDLIELALEHNISIEINNAIDFDIVSINRF